MAGLTCAVLLERGANSTECQYGRLHMREAGAQVAVIGLGCSGYVLEDLPQLVSTLFARFGINHSSERI